MKLVKEVPQSDHFIACYEDKKGRIVANPVTRNSPVFEVQIRPSSFGGFVYDSYHADELLEDYEWFLVAE